MIEKSVLLLLDILCSNVEHDVLWVYSGVHGLPNGYFLVWG